MKSKFESRVVGELATHTTKLDNIEMQLKSIDRNLSHNMGRINELETSQAFLRGMVIFLGGTLSVFIGLATYLN